MRNGTIDVSRYVAEMERRLRAPDPTAASEEVIALLRCWQHDAVLDAASREKAGMLVREFATRRIPGGKERPLPPSAPRRWPTTAAP